MTTDLSQAIDALTGQQAVRVLADVTDYQASLPDPARLRALDTGLRQALTTGTDLHVYRQPGIAAEPGDLARTVLHHLAATRPKLIPVITRAITGADEPTRLDPATLAVGALVIAALQTEIKLVRSAQGRWTLTFHKHPMRDSSLGHVITKLLAAYLPGSK